MMRLVYGVVVGVLVMMGGLITSAHAEEIYPLNTPAQTAQFEGLLKQLRCLVCQNQDLADSNAPLAKDLKNEVYQLVLDGKSDSEVMEYLTNRYGDFILFNPPVKGITLLLWGAPLLFVLCGLLVFFYSFRGRSDV